MTDITAADMEIIRSALSYAAEDLAERATFEDKRDNPHGEAEQYRQSADEYTAVLDRLDDVD